MVKQKYAEPFEPMFDIESAVEESSLSEEALFCRLDALIGGNTLHAAIAGTLTTKLRPEMLTEDDLDLISLTVLVSEETCESRDRVKTVAELAESMYGVAQYFRFMGRAIESDWIEVFPNLILSEDIQHLPDTELTRYIADEARKIGMNDRDLFALIGFFCIGESGTLQ